MTRDPITDPRPGDSWLVAVAHPDDETFGCGSLIAFASRAGASVAVLCATRGELGERTPAVPPDADLGVVRAEELHEAARILGAGDVVLLDHSDSGFEGPMPDGAFCTAPRDEIVAVLVAEIDRRRPTVVVTINGSDGHRDHVHMRDALRVAVGAVEVAPVLAEVGLANSVMRRWAEEMATLDPDSPYLEIDLDVLGTRDDEFTHVLRLPDLVPLRLEAFAAHRSQRPPTEGLSDGLREAVLADTYVMRVDGTG